MNSPRRARANGAGLSYEACSRSPLGFEGVEGWELGVSGADEIVDDHVRHSAITSQSIGVSQLGHLLDHVPADADSGDYRRAVVDNNVLSLQSQAGRIWRFKTLRRLYLLRPDSLLFRALRDLWTDEPEARPLLAALCAMATDTVFRASVSVITNASIDEEVTSDGFAEVIEARYPGVYAPSSLQKAASNAYRSWEQSGHLGPANHGHKSRRPATCRPADVAYALLLGHLEGHRGEALFETTWTQILDEPRSSLDDLTFAASQRGMLEYRSAGGVTEVGFRELLRPVEGELL
jgi:hypothetical protein